MAYSFPSGYPTVANVTSLASVQVSSVGSSNFTDSDYILLSTVFPSIANTYSIESENVSAQGSSIFVNSDYQFFADYPQNNLSPIAITTNSLKQRISGYIQGG